MFSYSSWKLKKQITRYKQLQSKYNAEHSFSEAIRIFPDPNELYLYMHHYFHHRCPQIIRDHRCYFSVEQRGFGEDAFHAMWYLLLLEYRPVNMLEIGVYRGQTISLWSLINKYLHHPQEISGISPFSPVGDSVSNYLMNLDYIADVSNSFAYFELQNPTLVKALSTDTQAKEHIQSRSWDLIYIDGGHDFETALADYQLCKNHLSANGILVLDDASLSTDYQPLSFAFAGHPGPSRVARKYADKEMRFLCAVGHNNIYQKL